MGATLQSLVNVQISLQAAQAQAKGFGIGLILGTSNRFTGGVLWKLYGSAAAMLADGFMSSDPEYVAAVSYFKGDPNLPTPQQVMVGYASADVAQVETITPTYVDNATYTVTINGVDSTYSTTTGGSASSVVTGLAAAINAQSPALPVVTSGSNTLILTAAAAGEAFTCAVGAHLSKVDTTPDAGPDTALTAIVNAGGTAWYGLILCSRTAQDILDAASWIETNGNNGLYVFWGCSQDSAVLTSASTDIASKLQALSYLRTGYLWSDDQAHFPEAAVFGTLLPQDPGSISIFAKTLSGITPTALSVLTATAVANLTAKNANYYCNIAGANIVQPGVQSGGQWLDVVMGRDWIVANMAIACFNVQLQLAKVPYTDKGIQLFVNAMRGVLKQAVQKGILTPGVSAAGVAMPLGYLIAPPTAASVASYKQSRVLPSIPFQGLLAGAINGLTLTGTLVN
jgi:hypothetical protein